MEVTYNNLPEAVELLIQEVQALRLELKNRKTEEDEPKQYYGIAGIAEVLNCGNTTAQRIKNTGYIDGALIDAGRQLLVNKSKLLELYKQHEFKIKAKIKKSLAK